jgi:hypothetical protein
MRREHREFINEQRERYKMENNNPLKNMTHDTPGPGTYDINYDQIEDGGASYSLKGRQKNELFEVNNNYNDPTKLLDYDSNLNILPNLPDFNVVKESSAKVIFSKYPRFKDEMSNTFTNFKANNSEFIPDQTGFNEIEVNYDRNKTF